MLKVLIRSLKKKSKFKLQILQFMIALALVQQCEGGRFCAVEKNCEAILHT